MKSKNDFSEYQNFVDKLVSQINDFDKMESSLWTKEVTKSVDGLAASELRRLIELDVRRKFGVFFTPTETSLSLFENNIKRLPNDFVIYDPACGAGNLLISFLEHIKKNKIKCNNSQFLLGSDIHEELVEAAKARLLLKNMLLGVESDVYIKACNYSIKQFDGLFKNEYYERATHIVVNPPYYKIALENDLEWSSGSTNAAALFIDRIIEFVNPGTEILAILPDVLRSGTNYAHWRNMVERKCSVLSFKLLGQFDKHADVDVFSLHIKKKKSERRVHKSKFIKHNTNLIKPVIGDRFKLCIGNVVDNRDVKSGAKLGYVISRGLVGWSIKSEINNSRKHLGRAFQGPFVVIKRTSRMGDSKRAIATIINCQEPVFVDNHLIIAIPTSGKNKLNECQKLLKSLKDNRTDKWLNDRIRCRHLTKSIISNIPLWG